MVYFKAFSAGLLGLILATPLAAATATCSTNIEGQPITIFYDENDPQYSSLRERFFTRSSTCPGAVVIAYLTPELTPTERQVFCSNYDARNRSHSLPAQGRRDAYGRCVEPSRTCRLVNTTRDQAMDLVGLGEEAEKGSLTSRLSSTISAVTHSSGAMILSGNASSIVSMLPSAGSTIGSALAAPSVLAGAAASVVVIGGAVYLCGEGD